MIHDFTPFYLCNIQVEQPRDLARDSGQRKLTYSLQNHCASSQSVYLSRRLDSHWDKFAVTHHLKDMRAFSTEINLKFSIVKLPKAIMAERSVLVKRELISNLPQAKRRLRSEPIAYICDSITANWMFASMLTFNPCSKATNIDYRLASEAVFGCWSEIEI